MGEHWTKRAIKTLLDYCIVSRFLEYLYDCGVLHKNGSKMDEFIEALKVQDARVELKINFKKKKQEE